MEFEIGIGKTARRAYGFDEVAIVPSRRTRDPEDVDISWEIDAYRFPLPMMASAMDAAVSPATAVEIGRVGGLACLNLEGLWTRYEDPTGVYDEIAGLPDEKATRRMQELYAEPIKEELIGRRIEEIRAGGVTSCASLTPQKVERYAHLTLEAGLDVLVVQGTVVSGEHVSSKVEPLNLKRFIPRVRHPGHRRRVRVLLDGAAPDADRRGRRPGRGRPRQRLHVAGRPRHRGAAGDGDRRRGRGAARAPARDRPVLPRDRGRRDADGRRHREGDRLRRGRRDDRLADDPRLRGPRPRLPLGDGHLPPHAAAWRTREDAAGRLDRGDPGRARARERRHVQPVRGARHLHGHDGLRRRSRSSRRRSS